MGKYRDRYEKLVNHLSPKKRKAFLAILDSTDLREELFSVIQEDSQLSLNDLGKDWNNQYLRRTAVRANLAMIEGLVNCLNQFMYESYKQGLIKLIDSEIEIITEQKTTKNGYVKPVFLPFCEKIHKSLSLFAEKMAGVNVIIDKSSQEWKLLEAANTIRNQITHPKNILDFQVSDSQVSIIINAPTWFIDQYKELTNLAAKNLATRNFMSIILSGTKGM